MKTIGERIKFIQKNSGKNQVEFAQSLGVSKGSLILYQKNERNPGSSFLVTLWEIYKVNPTWLLIGGGEPFIGEQKKGEEEQEEGKEIPIDPAMHILKEAQKETGVFLNPSQQAAVLNVVIKFLNEDARSIRELLLSFKRGKKDVEPR